MKIHRIYVLALLLNSFVFAAAHVEKEEVREQSAPQQIQTESASSSSTVTSSPVAISSSATLAVAAESMPDWTRELVSRIQLHGYAQGGLIIPIRVERIPTRLNSSECSFGQTHKSQTGGLFFSCTIFPV